ncbi:unnamed protein product, partial [Musa textilis]
RLRRRPTHGRAARLRASCLRVAAAPSVGEPLALEQAVSGGDPYSCISINYLRNRKEFNDMRY